MKLYNLSAIVLLSAGFVFTACSDDDDYSVSSSPIVTGVTTGNAVLTATSANIPDGTVQSLKSVNTSSYEVGVVYSTSNNPTVGGTKVIGTWRNDTISTKITGLTTGTTYYYASYVLLQNKVYRYGDIKSFTSTQIVATNNDVTDVTYTKATFHPSYSGLEGVSGAITGLKIGRSSDANVLLQGRDYTAGTVEGLLPGTTYYYMPYVKLDNGYVLGEVKSFTTQTQTMKYVDLGLSVMWAECNLGAETEEGVGTYFGYGDQTGEQYSTEETDYPLEDIADTEFDVTNGISIDGTSNILSAMPTFDQVKELINGTTHTIDTVKGVKGIRFTAANGNSIFLPYTGYREGKDIESNLSIGSYWTGSVSNVNNNYANTLSFNASGIVINGMMQRHCGLPVRTVKQYSENAVK